MSKNYLETIKSGKYSLAITRSGKLIFSSKESGLVGLIEAAKNNLLGGSIVFDKTIGLAAAKICYWSKVKEIHCLKASKEAISFLESQKKIILAEEIVKMIVNQSGKKCLMEKIAKKSADFKEFLKERALESATKIEKSPKDGIFPDNFYSTTSLTTWVKAKNKWLKVKRTEMDKGILVNKNFNKAECLTGNNVKKGDLIVVGEEGEGIKVEKPIGSLVDSGFGFMQNNISSERSKEILIRNIAEEMRAIKKKRGRILFVVGPAVIHTGAGKYLAKLIEKGFVNVLFSGNALATHDLESNYYGTTLGYDLKSGAAVESGYHHHSRVINLIRKHGSIKKAVSRGVINGGVMYQCIKKGIDFVLCGSIRDDGPLPEVITDTRKSQEAMRKQIWKGIDLVIMVASTLHGVATGNILPASVKKLIVDINLAIATKLADRGTNACAVVTDVELFFRVLCDCLNINIKDRSSSKKHR